MNHYRKDGTSIKNSDYVAQAIVTMPNLGNKRVMVSNMPSNPITLIPHIDLAKAEINCGKEKLALETLKAVVKDLEDFIEACNHD